MPALFLVLGIRDAKAKAWPLPAECPSQAGETGKGPAVFFVLLTVAQGIPAWGWE